MKAKHCVPVLFLALLNPGDDWTELSPVYNGAPLPAVTDPGLSKLSNNLLLLFGGQSASSNINETWVYNYSENSWTKKLPAFSGGTLSARTGPTLVFLTEDKALLFGGQTSSTYNSETWTYDLVANTWTLLSPAVSGGTLTARYGQGAAAIAENKVIMFGGIASTGKLKDTWLYESSTNTWTLMNPSESGGTLTNRFYHRLAYIGDDKVIMFGGYNNDLSYPNYDLNETWIYDLSDNTWTLKSPAISGAGSIGRRSRFALAYLGDDKVLMYGGSTFSASIIYEETWIYDLSDNTWTLITPSENGGTLGARSYLAGASMSSGSAIIFGGIQSGSRVDDTWEFSLSGSSWTNKNPIKLGNNPIVARYNHQMAYMGDDKILLYGGGIAQYEDTWIYDLSANSWTQVFPSEVGTTFGPLSDAGTAYISPNKVLIYGGYIGGFYKYSSATWLYQYGNNSWTYLTPTNSGGTLARKGGVPLCYIGDDKILLFGGFDHDYVYNTQTRNNDTWIYDLGDNTWTKQNPSGIPSARSNHAMAYFGGDQAILFGGVDGVNSYSSQTWIYDLSENTWTQKIPIASPAGRYAHSLVYLGGDQAMLFGGFDQSTTYADTWVYDLSENTWILDDNSTNPTARYNHKMAETNLDGSSRAILFGGYSSGATNDTWSFGGGTYPLPVELLSFSGVATGSDVLLSWSTATETDNYGFEVERKDNSDVSAKEWKKIGFVSGHIFSQTTKLYSFSDKIIQPGEIRYRLRQIDIKGRITISQEIIINIDPLAFSLEQNYPNPFNGVTTIKYCLEFESHIQLKIYSIAGGLVKECDQKNVGPGFHMLHTDISSFSSGIYFYVLRAESTDGGQKSSSTKKMVLMK